PFAGTLPEDWVAGKFEEQIYERGPAVVEFLGVCPAGLMDEFRAPPAPKDLGEKGQLVVWYGGHRHRVAVAAALTQPQPLGQTGWRLKVNQYLPNMVGGEDPSNPVVLFDLLGPDGKTVAGAATARFARDPWLKGDPPKELQDLQ